MFTLADKSGGFTRDTLCASTLTSSAVSTAGATSFYSSETLSDHPDASRLLPFLSFLTATSTASAHKRLHKMWCWFFKQTHYIPPPPPFWNPRFKAEQKRCVLWVQSEPVVCLIWAEDAGSSLTKPPLNSNRYRTVASGARSSLWICCFCVCFMSWILSVWHESSGNCSSALSPIYQLKSLID